MSSQLYTLNILGVSLTVRTTESLEYLQKLENALTLAIQDVQDSLGIHDSLSVAIMAGFFLTDQFYRLEESHAKEKSSSSPPDECQLRMDRMIHLLDAII
jgi:cell division protein ZapA (FtsZ GTPase activity inhibitor)